MIDSENDYTAHLVNRFPALGLLRADYRWTDEHGVRHDPNFHLVEPSLIPEVLAYKPSNGLIRQLGRIPKARTLQVTRRQFVQAVGDNERVLGTMYWEHPRSRHEHLGDIFNYIDGKEIKALFFVTVDTWHVIKRQPTLLSPAQLSEASKTVSVLVRIYARPPQGWSALVKEWVHDKELLEELDKIIHTPSVRERMARFKAIAAKLEQS